MNLETQVVGLIEDADEMTKQYNYLKDENERLKSERSNSGDDIVEQLKKDVRNMMQTEMHAMLKNEHLSQKLTELQSENNDLRENLDMGKSKIVHLEKELQNSLKEQNELDNKRKALKSNNNALVNVMREAFQRAENIQKEYENFENQVIGLIEDANNITEQYAILKDEKKKLEIKKEAIVNGENKEVENKKVNVGFSVMKKKPRKKRALTERLLRCQIENEDLRNENDALKKNIESVELKNHNVEEKLQNALQDKGSVEKEYAVLEGQTFCLHNENAELKKDVESAESKCHQFEKTLQDTLQDKEIIEKEYAALEEQTTALIEDTYRLAEQYHILNEENKRLQNVIEVSNEKELAESEIPHLEEKLKETLQNKGNLEEKYAVLEGQTFCLHNENSALKKDVESAESKCHQFEKTLQDTLQDKGNVEKEYANLEEQTTALIEDTYKLAEQYHILNEENKRLQNDVIEISKEKNELFDSYNELQDDILPSLGRYVYLSTRVQQYHGQ